MRNNIKMMGAALAAAAMLAGCGGGSDNATESTEASTTGAKVFEVEGFDVTVRDAEPLDLSEYGTDLAAIYGELPGYKCSGGETARDYSGAIYLTGEDCPTLREGDPDPAHWYDVRVYQSAEDALATIEAEVESDSLARTALVTGNYVVKVQDEGTLAEFREALGR